MITTAAKTLHSAILRTIVAIFLLTLSFIVWLSFGIGIERIDLPGFKVSQFYIKLDKKLSLRIEQLRIETKTPGRGDTLTELRQISGALRWLPALFDSIHIDRLRIGDKTARFTYYDRAFYAQTDDLEMKAALDYNESAARITARIDRLHIFKPDLRIDGRIDFDLRHGSMEAEGAFHGVGSAGNYRIAKESDRISFHFDSERFSSLAPLADALPIHPIAKAWMSRKATAKGYILYALDGTLRIDSHGRLHLDPRTIRGKAAAFDARIRFHEALPPVTARRIDIDYRNDTLHFRLEKARYENKPLDGSRVVIGPVTHPKKGFIDLHIKAGGRVDDTIRHLLAAYGVTLPFVQTEGKTDAITDLRFTLRHGRLVSYRGRYRSDACRLLFDDTLTLPVRRLDVEARDRRFAIRSAEIVEGDDLNLSLTGHIDIRKKTGDFQVNIRRLSYTYGDLPLLRVHKDTQHLLLDFRHGVRFEAPALQGRLIYGRDGVRVAFDDLSRLRHMLDGPLKPLQEGKVTLSFANGRIEGDAKIRYANDFLYRDGKNLDRFDIRFHSDPKGDWRADLAGVATVVKKQKAISLSYQETDIMLLKLKRFLTPYLDEEGKSTRKSTAAIHIWGRKSILKTRFSSLPCDTLSVYLRPAPFTVNFKSRHQNGLIKGAILGERMQIVGTNLPDFVIRDATALRDLYGGSFDFDANGTLSDFSGTIAFRDTLWAKSATYNNILATVNSIPSMVKLQKPGFNRDGFKIKKGSIRYRYRSPVFTFEQISVFGETANIFGRGVMNLDRRDIHAALHIRFLEDLSSLMHKIPIAGYLLFGKDGTISVGLTVDGPLKDPRVATSTVSDIVTAPFNIIKRTITLPFHLGDAF